MKQYNDSTVIGKVRSSGMFSPIDSTSGYRITWLHGSAYILHVTPSGCRWYKNYISVEDPVEFEEVFKNISLELQNKLLFNLDIFR